MNDFLRVRPKLVSRQRPWRRGGAAALACLSVGFALGAMLAVYPGIAAVGYFIAGFVIARLFWPLV